jgi:hypothetical protein
MVKLGMTLLTGSFKTISNANSLGRNEFPFMCVVLFNPNDALLSVLIEFFTRAMII